MNFLKSTIKRKSFHLIFAVITFALFAVSCKKNEPEPESEPEPVIYVAGYEKIGQNSVPVIWKDAEKTQLPCNSIYSLTTSIFVSGEDIYIAGYELENSRYIGKIWKNGVAKILSDGGNTYKSYSPLSIFVDGNDEYVAGVENGEKQIAVVWKNGEIFQTYPAFIGSQANSVIVSNGVVYVVGSRKNSLKRSATLWKNGESTSLSTTNNHSDAKSLFISGNNIYIAGHEYDSNEKKVAYFWTIDANSVITPKALTNGDYDSGASSIFVSGTDVYIAGYESNGTRNAARLWKNETLVDLSNENDSDYSFAESVFVKDNVVYVVGYGSYNNLSMVAKIWKNGVQANLSDPNSTETVANSVFVK